MQCYEEQVKNPRRTAAASLADPSPGTAATIGAVRVKPWCSKGSDPSARGDKPHSPTRSVPGPEPGLSHRMAGQDIRAESRSVSVRAAAAPRVAGRDPES